MTPTAPITLSRDCEAIEIPSGNRTTLPAGTAVRIMQALGDSYTVTSALGPMFRIDIQNADALGLSNAALKQAPPVQEGNLDEKMVWDQLKTIYDPEIPVNIVDLGLVYSCVIAKQEQGGARIDIKMSMTAPGCGMADVLKGEVETKLSRLPDVSEVRVEIVFDPPWSPGRMSESAKLQLGFELDYGTTPSPLPVLRDKI